MIEVASAAQSAQISRLCTLVDRPVTISPHRTLNTCKGVIRCRELVGCDEAETLTELSSQGVTAIYNVTVKDGPDGRRPTNTFFVTFRLPTIPKHLKVGYIRVPVTQHTFQHHFGASNVRSLATVSRFAKVTQPAPNVARLITTLTTAAMK